MEVVMVPGFKKSGYKYIVIARNAVTKQST